MDLYQVTFLAVEMFELWLSDGTQTVNKVENAEFWFPKKWKESFTIFDGFGSI